MAEDKSVPEVQILAQNYLNYFIRIDSLTASSLKTLNQLKQELLRDIGESSKLITDEIRKDDYLYIPVCDLMTINNSSGSDLLYDNSTDIDIINLVNSYRNELSRIVAKSSNGREETNYYFDPPVANVNSSKELYQLLEKRLSENNVAPDDKEALKRLFSGLTFEKSTIEFFNQEHDWLTVFGILTQVQTKILRARADAFSLMGSRMCIGSYTFDKIMPLAYGPEILQSGESAEIQILMAAFDSNRRPLVETNLGKINRIENGKAYITIADLKQGKHNLQGKITIINKSGIPKTLPWEKEIIVIE